MKPLKIIAALLGAATLSAAAILYKRIRTMLSIRHIGEMLYKVEYRADYKLDKLLAKGVKDVAQLTSFVSKELFFGYPIDVNEQISGCTSFAAKSPEGEPLAGRNFDYPKTGILLVHTKPKKGYESYSMVCLEHLGISVESDTGPAKDASGEASAASRKGSPETLLGKAMILAAPYACVDGFNEKGLHVAVLELSTTPTAQDTGKPPIVTTVAVRMLLDKCATTEEAVTMLGQYDMFSSAGSPYHFFITDISGNSVVVEWPDPVQEMVVLKQSYVTNFQLAEGKDKGKGGGDARFAIVAEALGGADGTLSEEEVMQTLEAAGVKWTGTWGTNWSIVYNLSNFSMKICCHMDYDTVYEVEAV